MTRNEYLKWCQKPHPELSYEEYLIHIFRTLRLSSWRYNEQRATELIAENADFIWSEYAKEGIIMDTMVEVGFGCG